MIVHRVFFGFLLLMPLVSLSQITADSVYVIQPERVFDGEQMHTGWKVVVRSNKIEFAGVLR